LKEVVVGRVYQEFSEVLLKNENSTKISQEAFGIVSNWLPLGKVVLEVTLIPGENNYILEKKIVSRPLFIKDREAVVSDYQEKFSFGPADNNICFLCTSTAEDGHFTEEEAEHLKAFLSEMYIHVERMYLGKGLQKAYITQKVTGLPNQAGYMARVIAHVKKRSYDDYTSFYFNLRGFGLLNYEFCEKEVDAILKRYGRELKKRIDEGEEVGHLGGDNFVAFIKKNRAEYFLNQIKAIETYGVYKGKKIPVIIRATIGVFDLEARKIHHPGEIIGQPGAALNYARRKRKNVVWLTPEIMDEIFFDKQIYDGLTSAINNGDITTYYQPKVNLETGEVVGAEALVRWNYGGTMLAPDAFVPILEKSTRISELDFYILRQVCQMLEERKREGKTVVPISVNFSKRDLEIPNISSRITDIIDKYGIDKDEIIIEVTETAYSDEQERLLSFLRQMRDNDISTSIDDFGTGYSSLSVIREYPVSEIKIDKSFIDRADLTREDEAIVGSVIAMARMLRLKVITEGVDKCEQVDFLLRLGCSRAQGFLFDKPLCYDDFSKVLDRGRYEVTWAKKRK
jgi:EAL domain-containing protein (putative c-di-GMP-specific phosphodiesterase class I)/GGDEF domain-containing protein